MQSISRFEPQLVSLPTTNADFVVLKQLAVAAGYQIISTASPKTFELVKKLGASQIFDNNSPTLVSDVVEASKGRDSMPLEWVFGAHS